MDTIEEVAKLIDPEAFGLPDAVDRELSDRDTARERARRIIELLNPR